jgi:hypothetical protein
LIKTKVFKSVNFDSIRKEVKKMLNETLEVIYTSVSAQIPDAYKPIVILSFYTILIAVYAIFIWKFYKFLAKRNIIEMNLSRYNRTEHPTWNKFLACIFFLLEYIIILPVLVFFWFSVLAIFLLVLSESPSVSQILILSAAIVAATRMAAYYSGTLAKDLAKMFPLTLLAVFLSDPHFFSPQVLFSRFSQIPALFSNVLIYLIFIAAVEIIFRLLFLFVDFLSSEEEREVQEKTG